jgi:hypothetical protein
MLLPRFVWEDSIVVHQKLAAVIAHFSAVMSSGAPSSTNTAEMSLGAPSSTANTARAESKGGGLAGLRGAFVSSKGALAGRRGPSVNHLDKANATLQVSPIYSAAKSAPTFEEQRWAVISTQNDDEFKDDVKDDMQKKEALEAAAHAPSTATPSTDVRADAGFEMASGPTWLEAQLYTVRTATTEKRLLRYQRKMQASLATFTAPTKQNKIQQVLDAIAERLAQVREAAGTAGTAVQGAMASSDTSW